MTVALVTGAAGGLGAALTNALVAAGHDVIAVDRRDAVSSLASAHCRTVVGDVSVPGTVGDALEAAWSDGVRVAHVVALVGGALAEEKESEDPATLPLEVVRATVELNLVTAFSTLREAVPFLRRLESDRSITLTSSTGAHGSFGLGAYAASKAGLVGLVRALAGGLGREGIRLNAVTPGDVPTPRNVREWAHQPRHYELLGARTAAGRVATAEEVAQAYVAIMHEPHVLDRSGDRRGRRPGRLARLRATARREVSGCRASSS